MEHRNRIAQYYGYAVCLVCIITLLISTGSLIGAVFELSNPLHARTFSNERQPSLASFENYKMDVLRSPQDGRQPAAQGYSPNDETLRAMYEAAKDAKIQSVRLQAYRIITADGLLVGVCLVLFAIHWIWMRRLAKQEGAGS
jgi:hypothetical protein